MLVSSVGCQEADPTAAQEESLRVVASREAIAYDFAYRDNLPHGVAGDESLVFVTEPLVGRVVALSRTSGREIAELPTPPAGFLLPFALRVPEPGRLVVLDPGGFPDPTGGLPVASIIEYDYDYDRRSRTFTATHVRTIRLEGVPTVFTEDIEVLADGRYVISEAGIGALWMVSPDGIPSPAVFPASPSPADTIPELGPCAFPTDVVVDGIPFRLAGDFAPGVGSLASDDTWLYFGSTCRGGLYRIPIASLADGRPPFARADDIELLSAPPAGASADILKGLSVDVYGDPDALYAASPLELAVVRIDLETGERETVVQESHLLDFPVATTFLPPRHGVSPLVVVSEQEHRWTAINVAIEEDLFRTPFTLAKVYPWRRDHGHGHGHH
ncbi:MAG: hypothetical protein KC619_33380 [Myxococcales bacterium]|nr:hypothetical protein [Myxococcales bacterium]